MGCSIAVEIHFCSSYIFKYRVLARSIKVLKFSVLKIIFFQGKREKNHWMPKQVNHVVLPNSLAGESGLVSMRMTKQTMKTVPAAETQTYVVWWEGEGGYLCVPPADSDSLRTSGGGQMVLRVHLIPEKKKKKITSPAH